MLQLDVYNMEGAKVDTMEVDEAVFGGAVNRALLREAVLMYEARQRAGTASTKTRSEVSGSRKKPFRQKGTGRARQGSWLSPHHRGGAVAFGPKPRDYSYSIPKKARRGALQSAFLDKLQTATHVVDEIKLDAPKTARIAGMLKNLDVRGTCLIATLGASDTVVRSVRNLPGVEIKRIRDVNAYDLLRRRNLVVTRRALEHVIERFANHSRSAEGC